MCTMQCSDVCVCIYKGFIAFQLQIPNTAFFNESSGVARM